MTPKLSPNQMSEYKETKKMKVAQLHEKTPNLLLNPTPTPKIAHYGPKKEKITAMLSNKSETHYKGDREQFCTNFIYE